jgi:hypothetical protein
MKHTFESEPILERWTPHWGSVRLYAPDAPAKRWASLPWMVETEKGGLEGKPVRDKVKASVAHRVYGSPVLLEIDPSVRFRRVRQKSLK